LADPGRTRYGQFSAKMAAEGYTSSEQRLQFAGATAPQGRLMSFVRGQR
jgi:hypothetical protein